MSALSLSCSDHSVKPARRKWSLVERWCRIEFCGDARSVAHSTRRARGDEQTAGVGGIAPSRANVHKRAMPACAAARVTLGGTGGTGGSG